MPRKHIKKGLNSLSVLMQMDRGSIINHLHIHAHQKDLYALIDELDNVLDPDYVRTKLIRFVAGQITDANHKQ